MRPHALAVGVVGSVAFVAAARSAGARPWRVAQVPNGSAAGCLTCHEYPGGPRNDFGEDIASYGGVGFLGGPFNADVEWGTKVVNGHRLGDLDSDRDGRTNGDELLDPTSAWRIGQANPGSPALVRLPGHVDPPVVIRQVYVGGGQSGALFQHDFVELYNRSTAAVSLAGWSIQYAPGTGPGNWGSSELTRTEIAAVSLQPGQSYLVREASGGTAGEVPVPDLADATPIALAATGGKVVLVNDVTSLGCNGWPTPCTPSSLAKIVDLVSYGDAVYYEGVAAAPAPAATMALTRRLAGCADINSNGSVGAFPEVMADFEMAAPAPRNSASPAVMCGASAPVAVPANGLRLSAVLGAVLVLVGAWVSRRRRDIPPVFTGK